MAAPKKRTPSSFYFTSQYKAPFHRNEDRISQIDFRTFDPFVPEARQTVANCKKHRRQRHELSDKCKHVLAIIDAQERLLSTRPETQQLAGYSAQGAPMKKPEISVEFGDGIPEIAKEYVKFWVEQSGMVNEPFSRQYDVHTIQDEHNHPEKPSIVLMVPFEDVDTIDENKMGVVIRTFFEQPKEFSMKHKVGNVRIYSINKKTHEEDALGYLNHLPVKVIGKEIITANLKKAERVKVNPEEEAKRREQDIEYEINQFKYKWDRAMEYEEKIKELKQNPNINPEEWKRLEDKVWGLKNEARSSQRSAERMLNELPESQELAQKKKQLRDMKHIREDRDKTVKYKETQSGILRDMLSPEKNIAPNRMGEGTNPIGYAMQAAETPFRATANIVGALVNRRIARKEKEEQDEFDRMAREIENLENQPPGEKVHVNLTEEEKRQEKPKPPRMSTEPLVPKNEYLNTNQMLTTALGSEATTQPVKQSDENVNFGQEEMDIDVDNQKKLPETPKFEEKTAQYLNTSDLIIIAKLKRRGI